MPICKRDGFDNAPSKNNKDETFHDNDEVFFCEVTKEIFRDYEDYFRHVMVINSTVWQCESTGRDNLTYAEALQSEKRARKKMELFKDSLRPPVMLVIEHAKQSSINALNAIVFKFLRKRFFINEEVSAIHKTTKYKEYTVVGITQPETSPANDVYEETEKLHYQLRSTDGNATVITVPFESVRRQRFEFTQENLQMFIKTNVTRVDGILRPKPEAYKKYVTQRKISFSTIFIGKMPHFTPAKIRRPNEENSKKQSTLNKYLVKKNGEEKASNVSKLSTQEMNAKREKEKADKAKSLKEEMERVRREKQEKVAEQERLKLEKKTKLMEKIEAECTALLTKTDDLERTDQRLLPSYTPIQTYIPTKLLGDAFMVREFMHSFVGILSGVEVFRNNLSFYEMSRAFTTREVAGPLSDILLICLGTVFDMQREEEEECVVDYILLHKDQRNREPIATMSQASFTHFFAKRHYSFKVNNLPIDALTISEVLRLHLLSSGAIVKERTEKWRMMYRNGYTSSEDPGLALRMQHPHILRALKMYTIFQLPFIDIMRVLRCLMAQILSYSSPINIIEERMEQMAKSRQELRILSQVENRRVVNVQMQKRTLNIEYHQQCMDDAVKNDTDKKSQLEDKLNKKVAELLTVSDRDHKKYKQQVDNLNSALFNFLVYLGMDRAYRKYYVLESMPGIFVDHPVDCMDTCLSEPPQNAQTTLPSTARAADLPRNRKDLRAYLLRKYTEEEKKAAVAEKTATAANKKKNTDGSGASQENKENQENHAVVNGLTNGHDAEVKTETDAVAEAEKVPPTQYELYMCTGDPRNCIVHDERNSDRQRWAYLHKQEDIDALIESLNPLGERECQLREQLTVLHQLIVNHVKRCPAEMLSIASTSETYHFKRYMMSETSRKYNKTNFGFDIDADLNEVMYSALVDRVLQFENDIYSGDLGRLKVKDPEKWRSGVQNNAYDSQGKLHWGPTQKQNAATAAGEDEDIIDDETVVADNEEDVDGGAFAFKPYRDPALGLGDTMEIDSEDSADEGISLHDSTTLRTCVYNLASALLQVEQAIERRFIKEPFGVPVKESKDKEVVDRKIKMGANRLKQWEVSLMESTSYSQVFLHLNVLHDCILWSRSTNKSSCQVCRRGSDPEKMLLCDECNGGTHMFCMKPKMKTIPEGNWYCLRCVNRLGLQNEKNANKRKAAQKRKRTFIVDQVEEVEENISETSSVSSSSGVRPTKSNGRRASGRRSNKRMMSNEIEEVLDEDQAELTEEENESEDEVEVEESGDGECMEQDQEAEEADNSELRQAESDEEQQDDDEHACIVCSYDGVELFCVRCKDAFHLECINLKRPPRYNFICTKCKSKDEKKRKSKSNDDSSEDDDDDNTESEPEPPVKRSRQSRSSLRNSLPNGNASKPNDHRRSNRRTGEHLPLNTSTLYELIDDFMKNELSWPFLRPVLQSEVPDYYKIIKNPMDLAKVKSKLNMGEYQLNEEVMNDIHLIFKNCDQYNVKGNEIYQAGSALEKYISERCKALNLPFKLSDMNE